MEKRKSSEFFLDSKCQYLDGEKGEKKVELLLTKEETTHRFPDQA